MLSSLGENASWQAEEEEAAVSLAEDNKGVVLRFIEAPAQTYSALQLDGPVTLAYLSGLERLGGA
jgi:hypothetical protein